MEAAPQQRLCNPPATFGSSASLVRCATIPSATASEKAMHPLLTMSDAIDACTRDISKVPVVLGSSKIPPKVEPDAA